MQPCLYTFRFSLPASSKALRGRGRDRKIEEPGRAFPTRRWKNRDQQRTDSAPDRSECPRRHRSSSRRLCTRPRRRARSDPGGSEVPALAARGMPRLPTERPEFGEHSVVIVRDVMGYSVYVSAAPRCSSRRPCLSGQPGRRFSHRGGLRIHGPHLVRGTEAAGRMSPNARQGRAFQQPAPSSSNHGHL